MKRSLFALGTLLLASTLSAQSADQTAALKTYATKMLPRCPGGVLTLQRLPETGPRGFVAYAATLKSTDETCGAQKYLLHSPTSQQVLTGIVIPVPADPRPIHMRIADTTSKMLSQKLTATVAPFPLPDGLKAVTIARETEYGPFAYHGFIDASEQFLVVGSRGSLTQDPTRVLLETINASSAVRRGKAGAAVEIIELSDFQCPTCARAHEKLEPLIKKNLGRISYARIDMPLFEHHKWAIPAALGARAIQRVAPAKYWEYVDYVFKNQESIGKMKFDDVLKGFVEDHDIAWKSIEPIYRSKSERAILMDQVSRAFDVGINSTPTFIINGQIMGFGPDGAFTISAINAAINGSTPATASSKKQPSKVTTTKKK